jgi:hypothetical protein
MENRNKPLHDVERREADGKHKTMNDGLRARSGTHSEEATADLQRAGLSLGGESLGDKLRRHRKEQRMAAIDAHQRKMR